MEIFRGKASSGGTAIGRIAVMKKGAALIRRTRADDTEAEIARYHEAKGQAQAELMELYEKAAAEVGKAQAELFRAHAMLLDDFDDSVENTIRGESASAEFAVSRTGDSMAEMLGAMEDNPYMQARAADVRDAAEATATPSPGR